MIQGTVTLTIVHHDKITKVNLNQRLYTVQ